MKLIDKYIYAIGEKLPLKSRNEIKIELKSLLLDDIEAKYGKNPTVDQVTKAITDFGTPYSVAKRYSDDSPVISAGLSDIYFLILKIIVGAMSISFLTIFLVSLVTEGLKGSEVLKALLQLPLNIIEASVTGIGFLTLIFIALSRLFKDKKIDFDDDWNIKELENITIKKEDESKLESILAIVLIPIFLVIINIYPEIVVYLEDLFEKGPFTLGNRVNMEVFRGYIIIFSLLGVMQVIYQILKLKSQVKGRALYLYNIVISIFDIIVAVTILKTGNLFIYIGENRGLLSTSSNGIKILIIIGLIVSISELISKCVNYIKKEILANTIEGL